jgi:16S rRNA (cytosine967-C5)-methyltransferase
LLAEKSSSQESMIQEASSTRVDAAVELLSRIRSEGRFASDVFKEAFVDLADEERAAISRLVLTVLRCERLIDHAFGTTGDRERLAALPLGGVTLELTDPVERISVLGSLPTWLALRMQAFAGAEDLARALSSEPPQTIRSRIDRDALRARLSEEGVPTEPTKLSPYGLTIVRPINPFRLASFHEGLFELQDEGSQLIAELVAPPPKSAVIDFCAGAGGKTLHLSALLGNKGRVFAHDVSARKLDELRKRARRAGCTNVEATLDLAGVRPAARVLVDAPCSGLGVLRRNPELRLRLTEESVARFPEEQLAILERAAPWVLPNGRLIYSTCTFLPEENDGVVQAFLQKHDDFELMPAKEILGSARAASIGDGRVLRLFPEAHGTDAFFAAVLRRSS